VSFRKQKDVQSLSCIPSYFDPVREVDFSKHWAFSGYFRQRQSTRNNVDDPSSNPIMDQQNLQTSYSPSL
jgi:hypothetical protein